MQTAFARYGYGIPTTGKYDGATMEVVAAFQRHFRPACVDGVADHSTMATLHALLASVRRKRRQRRRWRRSSHAHSFLSCPGYVPGIHVPGYGKARKAWMAGSSPMTGT